MNNHSVVYRNAGSVLVRACIVSTSPDECDEFAAVSLRSLRRESYDTCPCVPAVDAGTVD